MKIVVFSYDEEIVTTLSIRYYECLPQNRASLCGGSVTKKFKTTPCPPCLGEALRGRSFVERTIFMVRV
jgi:hypothetical protein